MADIYNREQLYQKQKETIKTDWPTSPENKRIITHYLEASIESLSPGRKYSDLLLLKKLFCGTKNSGALIKQNVITMTLKDFEALRQKINSTIQNRDTYKKLTNHIRNLYYDAFNKSENKNHREIIDALYQTGRRKFFQFPKKNTLNTSLDKQEFYTEEEFLKLLKVGRRAQEKALLALAWESTSRPNEYLTLKIRDVGEVPEGFTFKAHISKQKSGTTHTRILYIFTFRAEFSAFWESHPYKDNPNAPLFYREDTQKTHGKPLGPAGANKILKTLDRISGVNKNGTLYFLRHGGYTWKIANGMNEAMAGRDMGWVPGSNQARRYEHLQEEDVRHERLRLADVNFEEEVKPKLKVKVCPFCNQNNSPINDRCQVCGQTLSMKEVMQELKAQRKMLDEMKKLHANMIATKVKQRIRH